MSMDFVPGSKIGNYILDEPIGSGSFGAVWKGRVEETGQIVAVKLLTGALGTAENAVMRADVEVLAATAAARSEHVVGVLGGGSEPVPYIVMEFIEGDDLQQRLQRQGHLTFKETIDVALAIADAIRALYDAGIIHRDIKPANVLIDPDGVIKLADFGIAKIVGYMTLTMTGQTAMTMAYAAPELWDARTDFGGPSNQSDLYAMGVLLYQCLAGSLPFSGNYGALYRAHAEQAPDFSALPEGTPPSLRSMIRQCLNKPPGDRPRDAAACIAMLERASVELAEASGERTREPARFGPWVRDALHDTEPWTWFCHHETTDARASVEVHFADRLEYAAGLRRAVDSNPRLAALGAERLLGTNRLLLHPEEGWQAPPPGRFQFWIAREDERPQSAEPVTIPLLRIAVARLSMLMTAAAEESLTVVSPGSDMTVLPDGGIYLRRPGLDEPGVDPGESALAMLRRLPLDANARRMLAATPDFDSLVTSVGPLSAIGNAATMITDAPDAQPTQVVPPPAEATRISGTGSFAPDDTEATRIGMGSQTAPPPSEAQSSTLATQMIRTTAPPSGPVAEPASAPAPPGPPRTPQAQPRAKKPFPLLPVAGGVAAIGVLAAAAFFLVLNGDGDETGGALGIAGTATPGANSEATPEARLSSELTRAPGGLPPGGTFGNWNDFEGLIFVSDREGGIEQLHSMNSDGSELKRMQVDTRANRLPNASPDGSKIAYIVDDLQGSSELWIMNADGTDKKHLPTAEGVKLEPNFSSDGKKIVFEVKLGDNFDLYVINSDGTGLVNLTNNPSADIDPAFSPDGTKIVFCSDRDGNMDLYVMNADGSGVRKVAANIGFEAEPDWSPDNRKIVFESHRNNVSFDIFTINEDGSGLFRVTNDQRDELDPAWSDDGTRIAYTLLAAPGSSEIFVVNADGTQPRNLTNHPSNDVKPAWTTFNRVVPPPGQSTATPGPRPTFTPFPTLPARTATPTR